MSDKPEIRVFDSITAAVENSAQPAPPPYAEIQNPQLPVSGPEGEAKVPPARKGAERKPAAKPRAVTAQAGAAEGTGKASNAK